MSKIATRLAACLTASAVAKAGAVLLVLEIAFFALTIAASHGWLGPVDKPTTTDFASFYAAGVLADAGTPELAYDHSAHLAAEEAATTPGIEYQFFNYPPVYLTLCAVLAHLPYMPAFLIFAAGTFLVYLLVASRIIADRSAATMLALAAFPIVFWNLGLGQNAFLVAALFGAATLLIDTRPVLAGVLFACLCFKPHFGLLVPVALIAGRAWKCFAAATATVIVLAGISVVLFGWETWHQFLATAGASPAMYASGRIRFAGFANVFGAVRLLGGSVPLAYAVQGLMGALAVLLLVLVWRARPSPSTRASSLAAGALVSAPLSLTYDLMLGAIAAAWLIRDDGNGGPSAPEKIAVAGLFLLGILTRFLPWLWDVPVAPAMSLGLFALVANRAARELGWGRTATDQRLTAQALLKPSR